MNNNNNDDDDDDDDDHNNHNNNKQQSTSALVDCGWLLFLVALHQQPAKDKKTHRQ